MRLPATLLLTLLVALAAPSVAWAQTCKYVDNEGRVTYSNVPVKNARKVTCFEPVRPPSGARSAPPAAGAAPRPTVDTTTQRQRDDERRNILESELAAEQQRLDEARAALAEQEAMRSGDERNYQRVLDRLKPYQEAVAQHEKNIASLKQELANLR
jgi:septal ring factor EnvC (AmiA/AmiB activator)